MAASNIPLVTLDSDKISDTMAARLTASLIQHVLFLKNQIPFPISQLARLPPGRNSRATRKKEDLLEAVDTLTCHLLTSFSALSTALALNTSRYTQKEGKKPKSQVAVAVVLGPSITGARARVLLSLDGLEVQIWGQRDYDQEDAENHEDDAQSEDNEECDPNDGEEEDNERDDSTDNESHASSPSVSETSSEEQGDGRPQPPEAPQPQRRRQPFSPRPSRISQTEETQILNTAERLLSRTIANACAEEDNDLNSEMAATQAHILIRAPRRFVHPSWIPRQNLTAGLDATYDDFLQFSGIEMASYPTGKNTKPRRSGVKMEGVWITCQGGSGENNFVPQADSVNEEDELIWWSWDGKIVGFTDW